MARKHVATGRKPPGGKRPGAGRPSGVSEPLLRGTAPAVRAVTKLRVPEGASEEHVALADWAQQRIIDVVAGKVLPSLATSTLNGARALREEVCGPVEQKLQHSGSVTIVVEHPYSERAAEPPRAADEEDRL